MLNFVKTPKFCVFTRTTKRYFTGATKSYHCGFVLAPWKEQLEGKESKFLQSATKQVSQQLFVKLVFKDNSTVSLQSLLNRIGNIYSTMNAIDFLMDTVVLPPNSQNVLIHNNNLEIVFNNQNLVSLANEKRKLNNLPLLKSVYLEEKLQGTEITDLTALEGTYEGEKQSGGPKKICLGGTFDRIHVGHKLLLTAATLTAAKDSTIVIGLADGPLLQNKSYKELIEPFSIRKQKLENLMHYLAPAIPTIILPIADKYGPTITDPEMDALVISDETGAGLHEINDVRRAKGWKDLAEVRIPLLPNNSNLNQNDEKMSSSWLRKQEWLKKIPKEPTNNP